jgi:hypothetical protein
MGRFFIFFWPILAHSDPFRLVPKQAGTLRAHKGLDEYRDSGVVFAGRVRYDRPRKRDREDSDSESLAESTPSKVRIPHSVPFCPILSHSGADSPRNAAKTIPKALVPFLAPI